MNDKNFTSRMCPRVVQANTANNITVTPIIDDTSRWLYSMINSAVISDGINCPLQSGQLLPQPAPESVFVTNAPPSSIKNIRSEEHTSELQSRFDLVCCLLL